MALSTYCEDSTAMQPLLRGPIKPISKVVYVRVPRLGFSDFGHRDRTEHGQLAAAAEKHELSC